MQIQQNNSDWQAICHLENLFLQLQKRNIHQNSRLKSREIEIYIKNAPLRGLKQRQVFNSYIAPPLPECPVLYPQPCKRVESHIRDRTERL